jgi:hypothetical protein
MREVTVGEILNMKDDDQELLFEVSLEEQANIRGGYRVGEEHKGDFCKLMMTMMEEGWFEMCVGKSFRNKEKFIMEIGKYLNLDLGNFYVNMSTNHITLLKSRSFALSECFWNAPEKSGIKRMAKLAITPKILLFFCAMVKIQNNRHKYYF